MRPLQIAVHENAPLIDAKPSMPPAIPRLLRQFVLLMCSGNPFVNAQLEKLMKNNIKPKKTLNTMTILITQIRFR